jgi:formylglycine-generating enzyme required for sulfatase activity
VKLLLAALAVVALAGPPPAPTPLVAIPGGTYRPLYPADPKKPEVAVGPFRLDLHPVTVGQFRAFVAAQPAWRRDRAPALLAEPGYLASWVDPLTPAVPDDRPVTEVSWFAARAYCASVGRRLPTGDEWELVARASEAERDASGDAAWLARVLAWYGEPSGRPLPPVRAGRPNAWGVHDMAFLVWEWVEDFNDTLVASDARESGDDDRLRFCGVGAISAQDVRDYAAFMRIAWRSALEGRTTTRNLGFRCAADPEPR